MYRWSYFRYFIALHKLQTRCFTRNRGCDRRFSSLLSICAALGLRFCSFKNCVYLFYLIIVKNYLFGKANAPVVVRRLVAIVEHFQRTLHNRLGLGTGRQDVAKLLKQALHEWVDEETAKASANQFRLE